VEKYRLCLWIKMWETGQVICLQKLQLSDVLTRLTIDGAKPIEKKLKKNSSAEKNDHFGAAKCQNHLR